MISPIYRFLVSHGGNAFANGVHLVLLSWIALVELGLSSSQLGWIHFSALAPNIILMLVAGALVDRLDPAKLLCFAQGLLTLAYLVLLYLLLSSTLSFIALLVYAAVVGAAMSCIQPGKEALIMTMKVDSAQKRISLLSITQFSLQSLGISFAALSETVGLYAVIIVQVAVSLVVVFFFSTLASGVPIGRINISNTLTDIRMAVRHVISNPGLRQLMTLVAFNGYMHMGVFLVVIPIMATRTYHHSALEYAGVQLLFVVGMIVAHLALWRQKTVEFPGQGALFSLLYTALIGFGLTKGPTQFGFYSLVFFWGVVAGNSAGRCRIVLQSLMKPEMKGRVMAVYQLMLFGAAPIGALVTGYCMKLLTLSTIFNFMSISSIVLFALFMLSRTLWGVKQSADSVP